MFCCETCKYKSNRKFNLQKHIKNIHNREATDKELTIEQISSVVEQISPQTEQISSVVEQISSKNGTNIIQVTNTNLACQKCLKNFKSFKGLKKHQNKCKGVSNPLECHYCHRIFATAQSKSKHLKICKIKEVHKLVETHVVNNNNTQYNNVTNNYIIHNYHRNNFCNDFETQIDVANMDDFGKKKTLQYRFRFQDPNLRKAFTSGAS
jgi:hypothetical protein